MVDMHFGSLCELSYLIHCIIIGNFVVAVI